MNVAEVVNVNALVTMITTEMIVLADQLALASPQNNQVEIQAMRHLRNEVIMKNVIEDQIEKGNAIVIGTVSEIVIVTVSVNVTENIAQDTNYMK